MTNLISYYGCRVEEEIIGRLEKEISKRNHIKENIINETYKGDCTSYMRSLLLRNMNDNDTLEELFTQMIENEEYANELGFTACNYLGEKVITDVNSSDSYLFVEKEEEKEEFSRFVLVR